MDYPEKQIFTSKFIDSIYNVQRVRNDQSIKYYKYTKKHTNGSVNNNFVNDSINNSSLNNSIINNSISQQINNEKYNSNSFNNNSMNINQSFNNQNSNKLDSNILYNNYNINDLINESNNFNSVNTNNESNNNLDKNTLDKFQNSLSDIKNQDSIDDSRCNTANGAATPTSPLTNRTSDSRVNSPVGRSSLLELPSDNRPTTVDFEGFLNNNDENLNTNDIRDYHSNSTDNAYMPLRETKSSRLLSKSTKDKLPSLNKSATQPSLSATTPFSFPSFAPSLLKSFSTSRRYANGNYIGTPNAPKSLKNGQPSGVVLQLKTALMLTKVLADNAVTKINNKNSELNQTSDFNKSPLLHLDSLHDSYVHQLKLSNFRKDKEIQKNKILSDTRNFLRGSVLKHSLSVSDIAPTPLDSMPYNFTPAVQATKTASASILNAAVQIFAHNQINQELAQPIFDPVEKTGLLASTYRFNNRPNIVSRRKEIDKELKISRRMRTPIDPCLIYSTMTPLFSGTDDLINDTRYKNTEHLPDLDTRRFCMQYPPLQEIINEMWEVLISISAQMSSKHLHSQNLSKSMYRWFFTLVYNFLIPLEFKVGPNYPHSNIILRQRYDKIRTIIKNDWALDVEGCISMNPGQFFLSIYELAETWTHLNPIELIDEFYDLIEDEDDSDEIKLKTLDVKEDLAENEQIKYEAAENNILDMLIQGREKQFTEVRPEEALKKSISSNDLLKLSSMSCRVPFISKSQSTQVKDEIRVTQFVTKQHDPSIAKRRQFLDAGLRSEVKPVVEDEDRSYSGYSRYHPNELNDDSFLNSSNPKRTPFHSPTIMLSSSLSRPQTNIVAKIPVASISFNNSEAEERLFHFDKALTNSEFNFSADYENESGGAINDRENSRGYGSPLYTQIITPSIPPTNQTTEEESLYQPTNIKFPNVFPDFPQHQPIVIQGIDSESVDQFSKSVTPDMATPITVSSLLYSKNEYNLKSPKEHRVAAKLNRVLSPNELFQFANNNQSERSYNDIMELKKRSSKSASSLRPKSKEPLQLIINNASPKKVHQIDKQKLPFEDRLNINLITPKFKAPNFESSMQKFERVKSAGSTTSSFSNLTTNLTNILPISSSNPSVNNSHIIAPKISLALPLRNNESLRRNYSAGALIKKQ